MTTTTTTATEHEITIDETGTGDDYTTQAFCTDACGWSASSHWVTDDEHTGDMQATWDAAEADGEQHLADVAELESHRTRQGTHGLLRAAERVVAAAEAGKVTR